MQFLKKRVTSLHLLALSALLFSSSLSYGMITFDYAKLSNQLVQHMDEGLEAAEKEAIQQWEQNFSLEILGIKLEEEENAAATKIVRLNKAEQEVQNIEIELAFQPGVTACDTAETQEKIKEVNNENDCEEDELNKASAKEVTFLLGLSDSSSKTKPNKSTSTADSGAHTFITNNPRYLRMEKLVKKASESKGSPEKIPFLNASLLIGSSNRALDEDEFNAALDFIYLIAPPFVDRQQKKATTLVQRTAIQIENATRKELASTVLKQIAINRKGEDEISRFGKIMEHGISRYLGDENTSMVKEFMESNLNHPNIILREVLAIEAFKAFIAVEQYEQTLKQKLVLTTLISEKL